MNNTIIFDKEGAPVSPKTIQLEKSREVEGWLIDKLNAFENALQERCVMDNEVFNNIGFEPSLNMYLYQVGMIVWGLGYDREGISGQLVGKIGQ